MPFFLGVRISCIPSREYLETVAAWSGAGRVGARRVGARRGLGGDEVGQRYIFQIKMAVCVAVIGKEVFRFILGDYENLFFSIEDMPILL